MSSVNLWLTVYGGSSCSGLRLTWIPNSVSKLPRDLGMGLIFTLYTITMLSIYGGKTSYYLHQQDRYEPLCGTYESDVDFRILPVSSIVGTAIGNILSVVPGYFNRYRRSGSPVMVGNIFSTVGDMFPRTAIASITGIGGMARWYRFNDSSESGR